LGGGAGEVVRLVAYAAVVLALAGLLLTLWAAPIMLSLKRIGDDPRVLERAFRGFYRWSLPRAIAQALAFGANLWTLIHLGSTTHGRMTAWGSWQWFDSSRFSRRALSAGIFMGDRMGASFARPALSPSSFVTFQQIQHLHFVKMMLDPHRHRHLVQRSLVGSCSISHRKRGVPRGAVFRVARDSRHRGLQFPALSEAGRG
jgi:hypothetical protein